MVISHLLRRTLRPLTSITAAVWTHRRSLAVAVARFTVAGAVVALIVFKIGPPRHLHPLVTTYHHLPPFARDLLGGRRLVSSRK